MKRQKFKILKILLFFFLVTISIIFIPILFIFEIILNFKRIDLKRYLNERFNLILLYKSLKNYFMNLFDNSHPLFVIVATSAGEISTLEILFESNKINLIIFTTSITGRNKAIILKNSITLYLPIPNFLYCLLILVKIRPKAVLFLEHEFWPSYFITSSLLSIKIASLQIRPNLFKKRLSSIFYSNLLRLSDSIFLTEKKEKYPYFFPFNKVRIEDLDIKTTKKINDSFSVKKVSIIFSSTHQEEEDIFFESTRYILSSIDCILFLAPRHPQRSQSILDKAKSKKIDAILYSEIKDNLQIFFNNLDDIFEKSDNDYLKAINSYSENFRKKLIIVDEFGILDYLYLYSKVAIIGATFDELGGGHNIYEPILKGCNIIVGPYLYNMLNIFSEAKNLGIGTTSSSEPLELYEKIKESWINSISFNNKKGSLDFSGSPHEKIYLKQIKFKQQILDEILKFSDNS